MHSWYGAPDSKVWDRLKHNCCFSETPYAKTLRFRSSSTFPCETPVSSPYSLSALSDETMDSSGIIDVHLCTASLHLFDCFLLHVTLVMQMPWVINYVKSRQWGPRITSIDTCFDEFAPITTWPSSLTTLSFLFCVSSLLWVHSSHCMSEEANNHATINLLQEHQAQFRVNM